MSGSEAMFADLCYFSVRSVQVKNVEISGFWINFSTFFDDTSKCLNLWCWPSHYFNSN